MLGLIPTTLRICIDPELQAVTLRIDGPGFTPRQFVLAPECALDTALQLIAKGG